MPNTQSRRPGTPPNTAQRRWYPVKHFTSRSLIIQKSESIHRQLINEKNSLEDAEDIVGDGGVEEEEEDDEGGGEATGGFGSVVMVECVPEEEADCTEEEGEEEVGEEVDEDSPNEEA